MAAMGEARVDAPNAIKLVTAAETLPKDRVGDPAYTTPALVATGRAILVPFADAGQKGQTHAYRTWIKRKQETTCLEIRYRIIRWIKAR